MDGPQSFTSVVARPYVQFLDTSYNNEHAPPSLGSVAMAQLQLSDPFTDYYYNNEPAISMESVAMVQLPLSLDQLTDDASYSNEQAPSMAYEKGVSQSASDGFSYNARPPSLTDVAGRDESYSGPGPMEIEFNLASMYEIPEVHTGKTVAQAVKGQGGFYKARFYKKTIDSSTKVSDTIEDGYAWRKYRQKEILNYKFPRCYFRCTHKVEQGCQAVKQVQKLEDGSNMLHITYVGHHTCTPPNTSQFSPWMRT